MAISPNNDPRAHVLGYLDTPPVVIDSYTSNRRNQNVAYVTLAVFSVGAVFSLVNPFHSSEEPSGTNNQIPVVQRQYPPAQQINPEDPITLTPTSSTSP